MRNPFRPVFACPTPFRSPLLPLSSEETGAVPRISCYHAEPQRGGRDMLLIRYDHWLLPEHGIDDLTTEELGVVPLAAAAKLIQDRTHEAGLSSVADTDQSMQASWNAASHALTGDSTTLPPALDFLAKVPLMHDALARHDLMVQKHGGLQRIENGRPIGSGTAEAAVVARAREVQSQHDEKAVVSKVAVLPPLKLNGEIGSWLYNVTSLDAILMLPEDKVQATSYQIALCNGFRGIQLIEKRRWVWQPAETIPAAVFKVGKTSVYLTEPSIGLLVDDLCVMSKKDKKTRINGIGLPESYLWHVTYAKRAFDKLRADAEAAAKPALPAPQRPTQAYSRFHPRRLPSSGITEY